jgi:hypothetical protein
MCMLLLIVAVSMSVDLLPLTDGCTGRTSLRGGSTLSRITGWRWPAHIRVGSVAVVLHWLHWLRIRCCVLTANCYYTTVVASTVPRMLRLHLSLLLLLHSTVCVCAYACALHAFFASRDAEALSIMAMVHLMHAAKAAKENEDEEGEEPSAAASSRAKVRRCARNFTCLSACLFGGMSAFVSVCLSICRSVCLRVFLFATSLHVVGLRVGLTVCLP